MFGLLTPERVQVPVLCVLPFSEDCVGFWVLGSMSAKLT